MMYEINEYVYCIKEECHGVIGIWTDETLAREEVDRLTKNCDGLGPNNYFWNGNWYGNDIVYYERIKVNVPW